MEDKKEIIVVGDSQDEKVIEAVQKLKEDGNIVRVVTEEEAREMNPDYDQAPPKRTSSKMMAQLLMSGMAMGGMDGANMYSLHNHTKGDILGRPQRKRKDRMKSSIPIHTGSTPYNKDYTPGRNDPCTCGSGKKFKKCCLNKN